MTGFLLIDKPAGITSHDVVDRLRRLTGTRRIGHAGTLDPFATGLLIVGVGREATKRLSGITGSEKEYVGTLVFGATSDTQDGTGSIVPTPAAVMPDLASIKAALPRFLGRIQQVPPMYSAKKIGGRKLYELARAGQEVARQPVEVEIKTFEVTDFDPPRLAFRVRCSAGTYIRTLSHDLGATLGCGAYLEVLRRTMIGERHVDAAAKLEDLTTDNWTQKLLQI